MCGFSDQPKPLMAHQKMAHYISKTSGKEMVMNRDEEQFDTTTGDGDDKKIVTWVRKDIWEVQKAKEAAAKEALKVKAPAPTPAPTPAQ